MRWIESKGYTKLSPETFKKEVEGLSFFVEFYQENTIFTATKADKHGVYKYTFEGPKTKFKKLIKWLELRAKMLM